MRHLSECEIPSRESTKRGFRIYNRWFRGFRVEGLGSAV